jgi:hypothetical protein
VLVSHYTARGVLATKYVSELRWREAFGLRIFTVRNCPRAAASSS